MIWKEIRENQLFVWRNGVLIYKRWLQTGVSVVLEMYGPLQGCCGRLRAVAGGCGYCR